MKSHIHAIVAIGASTGGPKALETVLKSFPATYSPAVLVVQHMPASFMNAFATRLNDLLDLPVMVPTDGQDIYGGAVYVAPGGQHLRVCADGVDGKILRVCLNNGPTRHGVRPAVDELFQSLAPLTQLQRCLVLLTGMGQDGALGMLQAKQAGVNLTIAQSQATCAVYGMPKAAIERGAVDVVLNLPDIGPRLARWPGP
ncbi:chemotaxis protein CheB [Alicyclobacillaceae bacterium I2511]|nr:chemotaxis protein CheB [Alicyclobacillaceae bacterium I2511]